MLLLFRPRAGGAPSVTVTGMFDQPTPGQSFGFDSSTPAQTTDFDEPTPGAAMFDQPTPS